MIATLEYITRPDPIAASKLSYLANVEVTGAAVPYRGASVLTAEQEFSAQGTISSKR
jgi:hypothetical protein